MTIEEIREALGRQKPTLRDRYNVGSIGIFGSCVWGAQKKKSDPDVLWNFTEPPTLFTFVELEDFLSEVPGVKVDLVMENVPKPRIKDRILKEAVYL
ncbi:MAG: DNA polymerase beta [Candidatus Methanogaster sp.]|uniref:DNA polymerase beta n=1 Tax=Candidatus Methanogaster sp. TaxID=3386292 RepID=A0AC61KY80_9EURY|nr:MAG: DNA polymerase beta [ANME-2 cluster archaeon]